VCNDEKSDLQILQILQNVHLAKPDCTAALCHRGPNSWAFVCEMGLEFIDKSSIRSDMMWFDFIHKFSNQSEKMYVIQPDLTSFDPVIRVFGWASALTVHPSSASPLSAKHCSLSFIHLKVHFIMSPYPEVCLSVDLCPFVSIS
jgi:hypothetical protein